jgi:hypothetical protein
VTKARRLRTSPAPTTSVRRRSPGHSLSLMMVLRKMHVGSRSLLSILCVTTIPFLSAEPSLSATLLPSDEDVSGIVKACAAGRSQQFQGDLEGRISLWKRNAEVSGKISKDDLGAILKDIPNDQQISPDVYRIYTDCILNAISRFLSDAERLRSDIRELASFPNLPETSAPPTLLQQMLKDKLPHRLFFC